ncbi:MAG: VTT domain-containing protein [Oscillospiraceae bacterium]
MEHKLKQTVKQNKVDFIKFVSFSIIIVVLIVLTIKLFPWIMSLMNESGRLAFQNYVHSKGAFGVLILLGAQILQVVVAFIPGEPLEVLAGLLYGTFGGYIICTIGILIGTMIIYYTVKWLGVSSITKLVGTGKLDKFKFLNDTKKLETIVFLLFFIPGTPKDFLTYFIPITKIKPTTFFIIVTVARIPSIISSTFAGSSIGDGKWIQTIIIFVVIGIISLIGIIFNDKIMKKANDTKDKIRNRKK